VKESTKHDLRVVLFLLFAAALIAAVLSVTWLDGHLTGVPSRDAWGAA